MRSTPSMDDKDTPSPPIREVWQYEADKILGINAPPYPDDDTRRKALGLAPLVPLPEIVHTGDDLI